MATRQAFLSDPQHRIRIPYTPKHTSWLNQIENWFGALSRKALRRASFANLAALRARIEEFIPYYNQTMARPRHWSYTGRTYRVPPAQARQAAPASPSHAAPIAA